mgnify:CR=1 FL=1
MRLLTDRPLVNDSRGILALGQVGFRLSWITFSHTHKYTNAHTHTHHIFDR